MSSTADHRRRTSPSSLTSDESAVEITATVRVTGKTGVEMEALTAVSIAALTVYDMCKAVDKDMVIDQVRLDRKDRRQEWPLSARGERQ